MNQHGIEELKELVDGVEVLLLFILQQAADGLDWTDASALVAKLISDKQFTEKLASAFGGLGEMKEELFDLDYKEAVELAQHVLAKVK